MIARNPQPAMNGIVTNPNRRNHTSVHGAVGSHSVASSDGYHSIR